MGRAGPVTGQARPTRALINQVPSSVVHQEDVVAPEDGTTTKRDNFKRSRSRTPPWSSRSNQVACGAESFDEALTPCSCSAPRRLAKISRAAWRMTSGEGPNATIALAGTNDGESEV